MEFTVKRSEWLRGKGPQASRLLREDGMKCCVGFYCLTAGISAEAILNKQAILNNSGEDNFSYKAIAGVKKLPEWARHHWTEKEFGEGISEAYGINDSESIMDEERERKLIEIFAKHGDTILFVD